MQQPIRPRSKKTTRPTLRHTKEDIFQHDAPTHPTQTIMTQEILLKLLLAVLVGGAIGAEREYRSKSAGFRTLTLICLGAALFTILSQLIGVRGATETLASNVVVGIGFVGAGVIFKGDVHSKVNGITTAAMIW